jgi:opacity protein-like surface antigen
MKKVILFAWLLILASTNIISASEGDQLPQSTMEGQTISSQPSSTTDVSDTLLPAPSGHQANDITKPQINGTTPSDTVQKNSLTLVAQAGTEDLSHQALATAIQDKDRFYFIKTGAVVPILDKDFRQFLDYGASVSVGAGKHINENLSVSVSLDIVMFTGDWSIGGDRKSIEVAAESWAPGIINQPGQTTIIAEDLPDTNLGIGYHSDAEGIITSSESLKQIDVHTDFYLFPITVNALYKFHPIGKITPYAGGGLGYCMAIRDSDSKALKSKYFSGPDYDITLNNSQTSNGVLLNFLGGLNIPIYKKLTFVAEASTTLYDLKSFDPILEISIKTPQNPSNLGGNDVTTYSYEEPKRIGVFTQEFVGKFSVGLVMPF